MNAAIAELADRSRGSTADLLWLATERGAQLLREAEALPDDPLKRSRLLRPRWPDAPVAAALSLLALRRRADGRFPQANRSFFTRESLEMATSWPVARSVAARFGPGSCVLDGCCGAGGDLIALAAQGSVIGIERNEPTAVCAALNLALADRPSRGDARVVCGDLLACSSGRLRTGGYTAFWCDPARRTTTGGRTRFGAGYRPQLPLVLDLARQFERAGIKVSPAIPDEELAASEAAVEMFSYRFECCQAVLWLGFGSSTARSDPPRYTATVVGSDGSASSLTPGDAVAPSTGEIGSVLYEPDPAVRRAHLVHELAERLHAGQPDSQSAWLTGEVPVAGPFARSWQVLEVTDFSSKSIGAAVRRLGLHVSAVKSGGMPFHLEPQELARWSERGAPECTVICLRRNDRTVAAITQRRNEPI
ncbi:MAG: hypothetical protein KGJ62_10255 [Armatimonadetes bacterium]|nr:hypothetical protein [Armatimonadota bacterium]MDE2207819.1 hypothetical protein [Armatimonadota bacterium]